MFYWLREQKVRKSITKREIVHEIKIITNRDFFLPDKNRFERPEQWMQANDLTTVV